MPSRVKSPSSPRFFARASDFRAWLEQNHATTPELWLGYYKKSSAQRGITYAEAVDEALCFGWIDGQVKSLDTERYLQRFTPRRPGGNWSLVNLRKAARLKSAGRMHPAGLAALAARTEKKTGIYSFENRPQNLPPALEKSFRAHSDAWTFFSAQPPGYRRTAIWWVVSAKQETTRQRRLAQLIADSAGRRRLGQK
jgi:Uncharacterized protein conserved in bacteria